MTDQQKHTAVMSTTDLAARTAGAGGFGFLNSKNAAAVRRILDLTADSRTYVNPQDRKVRGLNAVYGHVITATYHPAVEKEKRSASASYTVRVQSIPPAEQTNMGPARGNFAPISGELHLVKRLLWPDVRDMYNIQAGEAKTTDEQWAGIARPCYKKQELLRTPADFAYVTVREGDIIKFTDWSPGRTAMAPGTFVKISDLCTSAHIPKPKDAKKNDAGGAAAAAAGSAAVSQQPAQGGNVANSVNAALAAGMAQQQQQQPDNVSGGGGGGASSVPSLANSGSLAAPGSSDAAAALLPAAPRIKWSIKGFIKSMATLKHGLVFGDIMDKLPASTRVVPNVLDELVKRQIQNMTGQPVDTGNRTVMLRLGCSNEEWIDAFNPESNVEYSFVRVRPSNTANPLTYKNREERQVITYETVGDGIQRLRNASSFLYGLELHFRASTLGELFLMEDSRLWTEFLHRYVPVIRFYADVTLKIDASMIHALNIANVQKKLAAEITRLEQEEEQAMIDAVAKHDILVDGQQAGAAPPPPSAAAQQDGQVVTEAGATNDDAAAEGNALTVVASAPTVATTTGLDEYLMEVDLEGDEGTQLDDDELMSRADGRLPHAFIATAYVNTVFVPRLSLVDITIPIDGATAKDRMALWKMDELNCSENMIKKTEYVTCLTHMLKPNAISALTRPDAEAVGGIRVLLSDRRYIPYLAQLSKMTPELGSKFVRAVTHMDLVANPNGTRLPVEVTQPPYNVPAALMGTTSSDSTKMILYVFEPSALEYRNKDLDLTNYLTTGEIIFIDEEKEAKRHARNANMKKPDGDAAAQLPPSLADDDGDAVAQMLAANSGVAPAKRARDQR